MLQAFGILKERLEAEVVFATRNIKTDLQQLFLDLESVTNCSNIELRRTRIKGVLATPVGKYLEDVNEVLLGIRYFIFL